MAFEKKNRKRKIKSALNPVACDMGDWECREDVRALARASVIKADPKRYAAAKKMAATMIEDEKKRKEEAQAMIDLGSDE